MTVYALRLQNGTDTAARVRMADLLGLTPSGNLSARGGLRPGPTAGVVAVTSGTMNVTVQPFLAYVDGGVSDAQGGYPFVSDSVVTLTLANGHGSLSRTDVVCAVVRDSGYDTSGTLSATVEVVQGTAGAGAPDLPANAVPLRNIVVPAGASLGTGGLTSGALSTDRRQWLSSLGGIVTVASQAERDALPAMDGAMVYRNDTDQFEGRIGGAWVTVFTSGGRTSGSVAIASAGLTGSLNWIRNAAGGVDLSVTATDTGDDGWPANVGLGTLPAGARPTRTVVFAGATMATGEPVALVCDAAGAVTIIRAAEAGKGGVSASATWVQ